MLLAVALPAFHLHADLSSLLFSLSLSTAFLPVLRPWPDWMREPDGADILAAHLKRNGTVYSGRLSAYLRSVLAGWITLIVLESLFRLAADTVPHTVPVLRSILLVGVALSVFWLVAVTTICRVGRREHRGRPD